MKADAAGELQAFKAAFFKALAHPVRIRILERLVQGDQSVQELQVALGSRSARRLTAIGGPAGNNIVVGNKGASAFDTPFAIRSSATCSASPARFSTTISSTQGLLRQLRRERRDHASAVNFGRRRARAISSSRRLAREFAG